MPWQVDVAGALSGGMAALNRGVEAAMGALEGEAASPAPPRARPAPPSSSSGALGAVPIPRLGIGPGELKLDRLCSPGLAFGAALGAGAGVGSWAGMLASAWGAVMGSPEQPVVARPAAAPLPPAAHPSASAGGGGRPGVGDVAGSTSGLAAVPLTALLMSRAPHWSPRLQAWTMVRSARVR